MFNIKIFQELLEKQVLNLELSSLTKDEYISCIKKLERRCVGKEGESSEIIEKAVNSLCKDNAGYVKYIAAIRKYEREVLNSSEILLYGEALARLRSKSRKNSEIKKLACSEESYSHKINAIKDEKMKLAFRLQKASGLRIAEVADLEKSDVIFNEAERSLEVFVKKGKGNKERLVKDIKDEYLFKKLKIYLAGFNENEKIFYSAAVMKKKAWELKMETHDLRRINARVNFREEIKRGSSKNEARKKVAKKLGHSNPKTTTSYIGEEW